MTVTVTCPYYKVGKDVRRAVLSILAQTYEDLRLVVVNDGDPNPPWKYLDDIDDDRLVRFDLPKNRGRYFADAVIFEACQPDLWALQDADDWSEPERFATLAPLAEEYGSAFAPVWKWHGSRKTRVDKMMDAPADPTRLTGVARGYLSGVMSGELIVAAGGFHPGFRVGYDTYLGNMVKILGGWAVADDELYNRVVRSGSLTTSKNTKRGSALRNKATSERADLYRRACELYAAGADPGQAVRKSISAELADEVAVQAARLKGLL